MTVPVVFKLGGLGADQKKFFCLYFLHECVDIQRTISELGKQQGASPHPILCVAHSASLGAIISKYSTLSTIQVDDPEKLTHICSCPYFVAGALEMAIWFHDAIYDTTSTKIEEKSASLAESALDSMGIAKRLSDEAGALILLTKHDDAPTATDGKIIVDVDLAILGQSKEVFDTYEANVRKEYSWVSDKLFWPNRATFLRSLLERDHIFHTESCRKKYEVVARQNLQRSINKATLFALWQEHLGAGFPTECRGIEVDGADIVLCDSYAEGCISYFMQKGGLNAERKEALLGCIEVLQKYLISAIGKPKQYFERLLRLSESVLLETSR